MATPAAIQAVGDAANTLNIYRITNSIAIDATYDAHYCVGETGPYQGRAMWCRTATADSATDQNTAILAALVAGPCDTNALDN